MPQIEPETIRLNLGCGRRIHEHFYNLDVVPRIEGVQEWDAANGIPFSDKSVDFVYHSHVLEHLDRETGAKFTGECFRCLKQGGILRVVVPDLEEGCRAYLNAVDNMSKDPSSENRRTHDWMIVELIDQLCRQQQGGEYRRHYENGDELTRQLIEQRLGSRPFRVSKNLPNSNAEIKRSLPTRIWSSLKFRARHNSKMLLSKAFRHPKYQVGEFRTSGECHLWMYDRFSLTQLFENVGFKSVNIVDAMTSHDEQWDQHNLDLDDGGDIARPNSLYLEGIK